MKLHGTPTSPYVRKVRALAFEKNLELPFVAMTVIADPAGAARRLNPLGKVPVLELDDGQALYDSVVIAEYLDCLSEPRLIPPPSHDRWEVLRLCALADGLCDAVVARLLESRRPDGERSALVMKREEERVARVIEALEREVNRAAAAPSAVPRPLVGEGLTLADLAVAAALDYLDFRHPHDWRDGAQELATWLEALLERPSLSATAPPSA